MSDSCYIGDVRDGLRSFIAAGVRAQTCVTSPPYWGLRDYGTAAWEGGDDGCEHVERTPSRGKSTLTSAGIGQTDQGAAYQAQRRQYRAQCADCGARRIDRQIGLEPTIAEYVATMVGVFRLVREVLADDGTLWLNLGDSYSGDKSGGRNDVATMYGPNSGAAAGIAPKSGLAPKQLCGIPWRVAFALQADGWYLRSDIIWAKPNPMPESVTDRPTKSHEYLFLLAKSERYYYDAAAIAEQGVLGPHERDRRSNFSKQGEAGNHHQGNPVIVLDGTRNKRSVWTVTTQPYADAHFAVMPRALVEPCIMAGSRVGDTVLDPFMGSGTVAQVAQDLGRRWIGCELNEDYVQMQHRRTAQGALVLA